MFWNGGCPILGCKRDCLLSEDKVKKGFLKLGLGVMLIASFSTGVMAQIGTLTDEQKQKKEKLQIVVVEKKDREKANRGSKGN